jgi:hypothetical protein
VPEGIGIRILKHLCCSTLGQPRILNIFGGDGGTASNTGKIVTVLITIATIPAVLLINDGSENLDFATENHGKSFTANGLLNAGKTRAVAPFVELATERIGLEFDEPELPRCQKAVAA